MKNMTDGGWFSGVSVAGLVSGFTLIQLGDTVPDMKFTMALMSTYILEWLFSPWETGHITPQIGKDISQVEEVEK